MPPHVMSPAPVQPNDGPYEHQDWPAWMYGPEGQKRVFDRAEDVPDGWVTLDDKLAGAMDEAEELGITGADVARVLTEDQRAAAIGKLVDGNTQAALASMLTDMQAVDDKIEFLPSWPKAKLAETIVDNGGPLEQDA